MSGEGKLGTGVSLTDPEVLTGVLFLRLHRAGAIDPAATDLGRATQAAGQLLQHLGCAMSPDEPGVDRAYAEGLSPIETPGGERS